MLGLLRKVTSLLAPFGKLESTTRSSTTRVAASKAIQTADPIDNVERGTHFVVVVRLSRTIVSEHLL